MITIDWQLIATRIDEMMNEKGLTCEGIEQSDGAPHSSVHRLRKGIAKAPSFELIMQVCAALRISVDALMNGAIRYSGESNGNLDNTRGDHFAAAHHTGLLSKTVDILHWYKDDVYISEFLDKTNLQLIEWSLSNIANEASRLCAYRESSNWFRSTLKDIPSKHSDEIRKELNAEILGEIYTIHRLIDESLRQFTEGYILHSGIKSESLINRREKNGNDPQENK